MEVERTSQILETGPHRVFPSRIAIGIEVFVDGGIGFLNLCMCGRLEVHVQVLCEVPAQLELTVEEELLIELQRQVGVDGVLQVALLTFRVVTAQLPTEGNALRQIVQSERLGEVGPLRLALQVLERFPCLIHGRIGIVQRTTPLVFFVPRCGITAAVTVRVAVGH